MRLWRWIAFRLLIHEGMGYWDAYHVVYDPGSTRMMYL